MIKLPNALIIVGTNRNSGKTTLACKLIEQISPQNKVTGIKISPHFHEIMEWEKVICKTDNFIIIEESRNSTGKDSSRMLDAGADKVYYIQVWDHDLSKAFDSLLPLLDLSQPVICESGWLRKIVEPGAFFILNRKGNKDMKERIDDYSKRADKWIEFDEPDFDIDFTKIRFENSAWKF